MLFPVQGHKRNHTGIRSRPHKGIGAVFRIHHRFQIKGVAGHEPGSGRPDRILRGTRADKFTCNLHRRGRNIHGCIADLAGGIFAVGAHGRNDSLALFPAADHNTVSVDPGNIVIGGRPGKRLV